MIASAVQSTASILLLLGAATGLVQAEGQTTTLPVTEAQSAEAMAGTPDTAKCLFCHRAVQVPAVPTEVVPFKDSVHGDLDCTDCHTGIEKLSVPATLPAKTPPHPTHLPPVDCGTCHEEAAALYKMHGPGIVGENPDIPKCWQCHGAHDILPASDPRSHVSPLWLPDTCRRCHENLNLAKKYYELSASFVKVYRVSVHGVVMRPGQPVAATCEDCHDGTAPDGKRSAHLILGPSTADSSIYYFNIPKTCGRCHEVVAERYWEGIHGQLVAGGEVTAPVCTRCHGEHGIFPVADPRSPVSPAQVAVATCSPCHDSVVLSQRYGLPGGRLNTYASSYHGLQAKAGDTLVANCASCHGAHRVLPSTDPTSSVYPGNLQRTCGRCHPGISPQVAHLRIHQTGAGITTGWAHFFTVFYIVFIAVTIGLMVLHDFGDWFSSARDMVRRPFVVRMNTSEVVQHWVLMLSFIVLVITGFALRYDQAWWSVVLFGWDRGFTVRGIIHRVAGSVLIFVSFWHVVYLFGPRGRHLMRDMVATRKDVADVMENAMHFLGLRPNRAQFGRFSYMEKAEYWALAWGAVLMSVTGLMLWFQNEIAPYVPKGTLQVALVIHYYEAWLATLAIFVWHIYGTVFRPAVAPMNPAWMSGKMPKELYDEEHPAGPQMTVHGSVAQTADGDARKADGNGSPPPEP